MAEKTLSDFVAKQNKDVPFKERAEKFEAGMKPLMEELGITPWAVLTKTDEAMIATVMLKDLWNKE